MAERLAHRGAFGAHWSPAPGRLVRHAKPRARRAHDGRTAAPRRCARQPLGARDARGARHSRPPTRSRDTSAADRLLEAEGADALELLAGPFAVAWWRGRDRTLLLARDRIGYGPLHFTVDRAGRFVFASEYKALLALDTVDGSRTATPSRCCRAPNGRSPAKRASPASTLSPRAPCSRSTPAA